MRVELGSHVFTADDKDLGAIRYLVLNPADNQARTAVVEKGFVLTHDIEVPVIDLVEGPGQRVQVNRTYEEVQRMYAPFDLSRYIAPPGVTVPVGVGTAGFLWPTSAAYPAPSYGPAAVPAVPVGIARDLETQTDPGEDERLKAAARLDRENAVIAEGSEVISLEGRKVGEVARMDVDAASGRAISFVMRRGFLMLDDVELPGTTIASVDDRVVYLNIHADEIDEHREHKAPKAA